jgi:hypothetical protein
MYFVLSKALILSFRILFIICLYFLVFRLHMSSFFIMHHLSHLNSCLTPGRNIRQNRNSRAVYPAVYGFELARLSLGWVSGCVSLEKE